jgi:hypothetical protein
MRFYAIFTVVMLTCKLSYGRVELFQAVKVSTLSKTYAISFHEATVYAILAHMGISNYLVESIERNSAHTALLVQLKDLKGAGNRRGLVFTGTNCAWFELPGVTGPIGWFDNMQRAYWFEKESYVFSDGLRLPWKGKMPQSRLMVRGGPGNEFVALAYSDDAEYVIVSPTNSKVPLLHVLKSVMDIRQLFFKGGKLFIVGVVNNTDGNSHWESHTFEQKDGEWKIKTRASILHADEVLDFDPESSNILYSRWVFGEQKAFLLNLGTKVDSELPLTIWRNHGFFTDEGIVLKLQSKR